MNLQTTIFPIATLASVFVVGSCREGRKSSLDFSSLRNVTTICEKEGIIWSVHYGENYHGTVVYVVFNKGAGPSPVSTSDSLQADGSHKQSLEVMLDGKRVAPPGITENLMIVADGKIERGKFTPLTTERFRKILRDSTSPINAFAAETTRNTQ